MPNNADILAKVTGASKVTYTVEMRNANGTLETIFTEEGFAVYCNECGKAAGLHTYHCPHNH